MTITEMDGHQSLQQTQSSLDRVQSLFQDTRSLQGVPAFAAVADALPLIRPVLGPLSTCTLRPSVQERVAGHFDGLYKTAEALRDIFERASGHQDSSSMMQAYHQAVLGQGQAYTVEALMMRCLEDLSFLADICPNNAAHEDLVPLEEAVKRLKQIEPSVPEALFKSNTTTSSWYYNTGSGTQFVMSGKGNQNINNGQGAQYNGVVNQYARA